MPAFPLEEERDDVEDWIRCFRDQMEMRRREIRRRRRREAREALVEGLGEEGIASRVQQLSEADDGDAEEESCGFEGPAMDVVIMVEDGTGDHCAEGEDDDGRRRSRVIVGGAAVEYYKQARVGLLSYVVLREEFRGRGLSKRLHGEALSRLGALAGRHGAPDNDGPPLRAVFAETNTAAAGDVSPEQSLLRHASLHRLGYRLVKFPYAQPPLSTVDANASFDDIVLLVYFPFDGREQLRRIESAGDDGDEARSSGEPMGRYCAWFLEGRRGGGDGGNGDDSNGSDDTVRMDVDVPFRYVEDFYQSVFGYDSERGDGRNGDEGIPDYRAAEYYQLAHWFVHDRRTRSEHVEVSLRSPSPWEDCKGGLTLEWKEWQDSSRRRLPLPIASSPPLRAAERKWSAAEAAA